VGNAEWLAEGCCVLGWMKHQVAGSARCRMSGKKKAKGVEKGGLLQLPNGVGIQK
jgi:hypothetical protein